jgi:hypothetical protein
LRIARALDCSVPDLTGALDQLQIAPADFEFFKLMALPGAVDLLKRYEALSPEGRAKLVGLLMSIRGPQAGSDQVERQPGRLFPQIAADLAWVPAHSKALIDGVCPYEGPGGGWIAEVGFTD